MATDKVTIRCKRTRHTQKRTIPIFEIQKKVTKYKEALK